MLKVLLLLKCHVCEQEMGLSECCSLLEQPDWQLSARTLFENLHELAEEFGWIFSKNEMVCGPCEEERAIR